MSNDIYDIIDSIAADQQDAMLVGRLVRLKTDVRKAMEGVRRARTDSVAAKSSPEEEAYVERVRNCILFKESWIRGGYVRVRKHDLQRVLNRLANLEREVGVPQGCEARQMSDSMVCERCKQGWDMNDPAPPVCVKVACHE